MLRMLTVCAFGEFCKYGSCGEECAFSEIVAGGFYLTNQGLGLVPSFGFWGFYI